MGRSAVTVPEPDEHRIETSTLTDEIASLLVAIEDERVPDRLLKLALELQEALSIQKQRRNPS